ncbi:MAG: hypothetical protein PVI30_22315 [Myxococcales bacterium]|jgi:hypothetical protein
MTSPPSNGLSSSAVAVALALAVGLQPAAAGAQATPTASARHTDAHADRVVLAPTAETHPAGTLYLTSYEILVPAVGYALTDRLQVTATGLTDFRFAFADLTLKANVLRSRWLRVAAHSALDVIIPDRSDDPEEDDSGLVVGRVGGTAQICFELACRSSLSLSATLVAHDAADTILPVGVAAAFTARASDTITFLLEYDALLNATDNLPILDLPVYGLAYGVRFTGSRSWALDLTLLRRMQSESAIRSDRPGLFDLLGVPFVAFTYRFVP